MTLTYTLGKLPTSATDSNLDIFLLDQTKIGKSTKSAPNAKTVSYNYAYDNGADLGAPLALFHNIQRSSGTIENTVGLSGNFIVADSETGQPALAAPFSARLIVRTTSGLYVTATHYRQIIESLFGAVKCDSSNAASTVKFGRMIEGYPIWD